MTRSDKIAPLHPGVILGGYQLLMAVGAGGMGRVWAARRVDAPGQSLVALKTAIEEMAGDEQFERMLLDEARIAASVIHPNVCAISAVGAEQGIPYLVMDWMDGGTLLELLAACPSRRLDCYLAARIISDVAAGLHAAHELTGADGALLNVVHRDVSPQNILLSSAGHVKVADFGVAKARGQLHAPTVTGEVKGKLSYMAPEQLTSKTFDRRADVFALGCCLYEATTGARPYHGNDALETMYKLLESTCDPPSTLVDGYPEDLEAIVLQALEKDPAKRYQTADDLRIALAGFLAKHGQLITDREISSFIHLLLADSLEKRTRALEEATRTLSRRKSSSLKTGYALPKSKTGDASDTPRTWNTPRPPATRRLFVRWAILGAAAAGIVAPFAWYNGTDARSIATAPASASSLTEPTRATTQQVTVTLRTEPTSATMRIDNSPELTGPQVIVTGPSQELHSVVVTLDGYAPLTRQVVFDHNQEVVFGLKELVPSPEAAPAATSKAVKKVAPSPPWQGSVLQTKEPTAGEARTTKPNRPKRPIDHSNPFADP